MAGTQATTTQVIEHVTTTVSASPPPTPPPPLPGLGERPTVEHRVETSTPVDLSRLNELRDIRQRIQGQSQRLREYVGTPIAPNSLQTERDKLLRERQRAEQMSYSEDFRLEARERELVEREARLEKEWEEIEHRRIALETEIQHEVGARRSPRRVNFTEGGFSETSGLQSFGRYESQSVSSEQYTGLARTSLRSSSPTDSRVHPHVDVRHQPDGPPRPLRPPPSAPVEYSVRGPASPSYQLPPYRAPLSPAESSLSTLQRSPPRSLLRSPHRPPLAQPPRSVTPPRPFVPGETWSYGPADYAASRLLAGAGGGGGAGGAGGVGVGAAVSGQGTWPMGRRVSTTTTTTTTIASRATVNTSPTRHPSPSPVPTIQSVSLSPRLAAQYSSQGRYDVGERQSVARPTTPERFGGSPLRPGPFFAGQSRFFEHAQRNLQELGREIGRPLQFDHNQTAVIPLQDDVTVFCSFDPSTNRIYLYATLVTRLPTDKATRLRLYETLLEGAMLGRETAGGGVGISLQNNFCLLSSSLDMEYATFSALRDLMPTFVESLAKWRRKIQALLNGEVSLPIVSPSPTPSAPLPAPSPSPSDLGQHAAIGLELTDGVRIDGQFQRYTDGIVVVASKGPAAQAGIVPNDIILMVDGKRTTSLAEFQAIARRLVPGTTVSIVVQRDGVQFATEVLLGAAPRPPGKKYKNVVKFYAEEVDHV